MADRDQFYCENCQKHTLHELDPDPVNHLVHLLVTLFLCGIWLPIWILLAIGAPRRHYRCLTCGQIPGTMTPKEIADEERRKRVKKAKDAERAADERELRRIQAHIRSEQFAETRDRTIVATKRTLSTASAIAKAAIVSTAQQIDAVVVSMTGDDIYSAWAVRVLLLVLMGAIAGGVLYLIAVAIW